MFFDGPEEWSNPRAIRACSLPLCWERRPCAIYGLFRRPALAYDRRLKNTEEVRVTTQSEKLAGLVERARKVEMGPTEQRIQRKSFVYGNTNIENPRVTRTVVDIADQKISATTTK
jgi:hypothetical protein